MIELHASGATSQTTVNSPFKLWIDSTEVVAIVSCIANQAYVLDRIGLVIDNYKFCV